MRLALRTALVLLLLAYPRPRALCVTGVPATVLQRVFEIRVANSVGSGFVLDYPGGTQFLVTAKHMVGRGPDVPKIEILHDDGWKALAIERILRCNNNCDIAVIVLKVPLRTQIAVPQPELDRTGQGYYVGEEVFFVGFPLGLSMGGVYHGHSLNGDFPIPLVKRATVSGIYPENGFDLLDGFNNHGFSGGPVIVVPDNPASHAVQIIGVVSGFIPQELEPRRIEGTPSNAGAAPPPWQVNSGILIAWRIAKSADLIDSYLHRQK